MIIVLKRGIVASTITILRCLRRNITPFFLKKENVTPTFNRGTKSKKQNLRPISILPFLSKISKKLISEQ